MGEIADDHANMYDDSNEYCDSMYSEQEIESFSGKQLRLNCLQALIDKEVNHKFIDMVSEIITWPTELTEKQKSVLKNTLRYIRR